MNDDDPSSLDDTLPAGPRATADGPSDTPVLSAAPLPEGETGTDPTDTAAREQGPNGAGEHDDTVRAPDVSRATSVMAVGTSLSRITGVLRIVALAYAFRADAQLADAYNLANTMPNIVHDIVLGGVVSATFIPVFVQRLTTRSQDEAWEAISAITSVTMLVIAAASVLFLALTPLVIDATTALNHSSQAATSRHVAIDLLFLFVPQLTGYGFISLATALLNARRRFGAPMFSPIANNVILVAVLIAFGATVHGASVAGVDHHRDQLLLLGLGTTVGVVMQAALLVPSLRRAGLRLTWRPDIHHEAVRTIVRLSGWTFGLVVANQVALSIVLALLDRDVGGVSAYTYAWTFFQLPYGVVAVSVMAATAPELTVLWSRGDVAGFRRRMASGLRITLAIVVPAAAGELILAHPLVALLLGHGPGRPPTATTLAMLALGLPGFCVFLYAIRVLQSVQDLRSAFWLYVLENGINIVVAVALAGPLGIRGIALSISVAYSAAAVVALVHVRRRVHGLDGALISGPLGHVLVATVFLIVAADLGSNVSASQSSLALLARVAAGTGAGAGAYVLTAGLLGGHRRRRPGRHRPGPGPLGPTSDPSGRRGRRRRSRNGLPPWPEPLPPAGKPPIRPTRLGPTLRPKPDDAPPEA